MRRRRPLQQDDDAWTDGVRRIERHTERVIREAVESGDLSRLPGEGRPLPRDDDPADERWASVRVMRDANVLPRWAEARHEIEAERARLLVRARDHLAWLDARRSALERVPAERVVETARRTTEGDVAFRRDLAERIGALNARIAHHNLLVPVASLQLVPLTSERVLALAREE